MTDETNETNEEQKLKDELFATFETYYQRLYQIRFKAAYTKIQEDMRQQIEQQNKENKDK